MLSISNKLLSLSTITQHITIMNYRKIIISLGITVLVLFSPHTSIAQVTIGSASKSAEGALLDLKEQLDGSSTRGLGLPRVELTDLYSLVNVNVTDVGEKDSHTGLLIYNPIDVETYVNGETICKGLYVWDGEKWQALQERKIKSDITMTDGDGNVYPAKWFGSPCDPNDGAYWMTQNLYTSTQTDGSPIQSHLGPGGVLYPGGILNAGFSKKSYGAISNMTDVIITTPVSSLTGTISYGESDNPTGTLTTISRSEFVRKFGLLYSRSQAEGLCPAAEGWRIPDRIDWNKLIAYFGSADIAGPYLRSPSKYYLANDLAGDENNSKKWGINDNLPTHAVLSDFNLVPSGFFGTWNNTVEKFGEEGYIRRRFLQSQDDAHWLEFDNPTLQSKVIGGVVDYFYSARCIKDGR